MLTDKAVKTICAKAKKASRELSLVETFRRDMAIKDMAGALKSKSAQIIRANKADIALAVRKGLSSAMIDRLTLTPKRICDMAESLYGIAGLNDPIGRVLSRARRPNGLLIEKVTVPIGVILVIYESRPNVTSDCVGLCLKSANAVILRGGSEAANSNRAIFNVLKAEALKHRMPEGVISLITDTDRKNIDKLLAQEALIDLVMPRGGESLIREVTSKARMPVIKHYKGVCHVYVDASADLKMAEEICFNAKVQRPGVCNAMETMLVDKRIARAFLPSMISRFGDAGVEMRGSEGVRRIVKGIESANEEDWYTEYLDLILSIRIVDGVDEAIRHIMKYGSYHSDAIVTRNKKNAAKFLREVDSACVYVNASTRFTDGGEFGKGAEIGVSTDKIHARGPMGAEDLVSYKYIIHGSGQIRK